MGRYCGLDDFGEWVIGKFRWVVADEYFFVILGSSNFELWQLFFVGSFPAATFLCREFSCGNFSKCQLSLWQVVI